MSLDRERLKYFIVILGFMLSACDGGADPGANVWIPSPGSDVTTEVTGQGSIVVTPDNDPQNGEYIAEKMYGFVAQNNFSKSNAYVLDHFWTYQGFAYYIILSDQRITCGSDLGQPIPFEQGFIIVQYMTESEIKGGHLNTSSWKNGWMYSYRYDGWEEVYTPYSQSRPFSVESYSEDRVTVSIDLEAEGSWHMTVKGTFELLFCPQT